MEGRGKGQAFNRLVREKACLEATNPALASSCSRARELEFVMLRYFVVRTTAFIVLTAASTAVLALPHIAS